MHRGLRFGVAGCGDGWIGCHRGAVQVAGVLTQGSIGHGRVEQIDLQGARGAGTVAVDPHIVELGAIAALSERCHIAGGQQHRPGSIGSHGAGGVALATQAQAQAATDGRIDAGARHHVLRRACDGDRALAFQQIEPIVAGKRLQGQHRGVGFDDQLATGDVGLGCDIARRGDGGDHVVHPLIQGRSGRQVQLPAAGGGVIAQAGRAADTAAHGHAVLHRAHGHGQSVADLQRAIAAGRAGVDFLCQAAQHGCAVLAVQQGHDGNIGRSQPHLQRGGGRHGRIARRILDPGLDGVVIAVGQGRHIGLGHLHRPGIGIGPRKHGGGVGLFIDLQAEHLAGLCIGAPAQRKRAA